jgi:hypothetical protein
VANKETTLFESIPTTWKQFEAAVERLYYKTYWQRFGKSDRLTLQQNWHDDFWKQYPHLQNLDLRYGIEVDRYVENTANLNESKKAVLAVAGDLLDEARRRVERLGRLWPALEALVGRNAGKRYGLIDIRLDTQRIVVTDHDYEVTVTDDLRVDKVMVETRGKAAREDLERLIVMIDATSDEYERELLEPLRQEKSDGDPQK